MNRMWSIVLGVFLLITLVIYPACKEEAYTVPVPYQDTETYTATEPYTDIETYTDREPYTETETAYRDVCQTVMVQVAESYVCGQNCPPRPKIGPPLPCTPRYCTRYVPQAQTQCQTVPYTVNVTKYRDVTKTRTVTKFRDVTKTRTVTKVRNETRYRTVSAFGCSPPPR
jgi:hypothetical protein